MDSLTITLSGTPYKIQELTLGQLEDLHVEIAQPITDDVKQLWTRYRHIIAIALSEDHPGITDEALKKMRLGTLLAARTLSDSILQFGGFIEREPGSGEAVAGAA